MQVENNSNNNQQWVNSKLMQPRQPRKKSKRLGRAEATRTVPVVEGEKRTVKQSKTSRREEIKKWNYSLELHHRRLADVWWQESGKLAKGENEVKKFSFFTLHRLRYEPVGSGILPPSLSPFQLPMGGR